MTSADYFPPYIRSHCTNWLRHSHMKQPTTKRLHNTVNKQYHLWYIIYTILRKNTNLINTSQLLRNQIKNIKTHVKTDIINCVKLDSIPFNVARLYFIMWADLEMWKRKAYVVCIWQPDVNADENCSTFFSLWCLKTVRMSQVVQ